jgi:ribosomal protein L23
MCGAAAAYSPFSDAHCVGCPDSAQVGSEGTFRTNEVILDTVQTMTKIETKRLLEAMYGVQVEAVHSLNRMGKRHSEHTLQAYKKKDFKRFYVKLTTPVDLPNVPKAIDRLADKGTAAAP